MKKLLALVALALVSLTAWGNAPFLPEIEARFAALESGIPGYIYSIDGLLAKRVARATYDVAVNGGTAGAHTLGVNLPAGSIIQRSLFYTNTQFVGGSTVALSCETANNIKTATDITGNGVSTIVEGASDGTAANMKKITSACAITATTTGTHSAGKLTAFIEYFVR